MSALLARSKMEACHSRTVERAMMQTQVIIYYFLKVALLIFVLLNMI